MTLPTEKRVTTQATFKDFFACEKKQGFGEEILISREVAPNRTRAKRLREHLAWLPDLKKGQQTEIKIAGQNNLPVLLFRDPNCGKLMVLPVVQKPNKQPNPSTA